MSLTPSRFVGRTRELEALDALWGTAPVWVWGAPGVGKSRLVHAWLLRSDIEVVTFDLSSATTEEEFVSALGAGFGLASDRWEQVREAARAMSNAVLVLDNADATRASVARFIEGMKHAVVTCRAAPRSERVVSLRVETLSADAARELFDEVGGHAMAVDDAALGQLLERLDGLPVAIEFAAQRTRLMTIEEQLRRLNADGGSTLDGVIAWMWQELQPAERNVLVQCAASGSAFTARTIEATAEVDSDVDVLEVLDALLKSSWLERRVDPQGEVRFTLLHALRDFALKATPTEELAAARQRVLGYWAREAPQLREAVEGRSGADAIARLQLDSRSILTAAESGLANSDERALTVLESLRWNACVIGPAYLYRDAVHRGCELAAAAEDVVAARYLDFAAQFAIANRWLRDAEQQARMAEARARTTGDEILLTRAATTLAALNSATSNDQLRELGDRAEQHGDHLTRARTLAALGRLHLRALDHSAARGCFRDSLHTYRAHVNDMLATEAQTGIAAVLEAEGRFREAAAQLHETREDLVRHGLRQQALLVDLDLARVRFAGGEAVRGEVEHLISSLESVGADGHVPSAWNLVARAAWCAGAPGQAVGAARTAHRLAPAAGDTAAGAVAAGLAVMFLWADGRPSMDDDLLASAQTLATTDATAALAHLVAFVGVRATQGSAAQSELGRASKLAAVLPETAVIGQRILEIGQAFGHLCDAQQAQSPESVARARALLDAIEEPASYGLHEFYLRFLLGQARDLLDRVGDSAIDLPDEYRHDVLFHANCHWIRIDGSEPIDLNSRKQLRVIVKALARQYFNDPSVLLSVEELLAVGWPGETMTASSGRSRIYTAIRDLRKMGLDALIVTEDGGYRLAPDVRYRVADPTGILGPESQG